ncbi:MAG: hypothetical protein ACK5NF_05290 [Bacilli bacterium]
MRLKIMSPNGIVYDQEVEGFAVDTNSGKRIILDRHVDFIAFYNFSQVDIMYKDNKNCDLTSNYYVALGYLYVSDNEAYIISQLASKNRDDIEKTYKNILQIRGDTTDV